MAHKYFLAAKLHDLRAPHSPFSMNSQWFLAQKIVRLHANFRARALRMEHLLCLLGDTLIGLWKAACTLLSGDY
jgi:hypothetical protein